MAEKVDWRKRAREGFLASGIDPADRKGYKNFYIDLLQKMALEEVLELKGNEVVLDLGCGSGRFSYWIAQRVKKVVGLEMTPEMIELAERHRAARNVEFMVYDGVHFPVLPCEVDFILSVGVLQYMTGEMLKRAGSELGRYLKSGGRFYLIEQASDNLKVSRPSVNEYLKAFQESNLECLRHYPIRNNRWWLLYMIRYGIIPRNMFPIIAKKEILCRRGENKIISYCQDHLFVVQKR